MTCVGPNRVVWPQKDDSDTISYESILTVLDALPDLHSYSRHAIYSFPDTEYHRVVDMYASTL